MRALQSRLRVLTLAAAAVAAAASSPADTDAPTQLLCDWRHSPVMGVESQRPTFMWAAQQPFAQAGYRLQVFSLTDVLMWDAAVPAATEQSATYAGSTPLRAASGYTWRVQTVGASGAVSAWSANASFTTGLWAQAWPGASPVWSRNATAEFVLMRTQLRVPDSASLLAATVFVTANPQTSSQGEAENGKLLGAYRLYIDGQLLGMGPGRPGRCGPVCPVGGALGACSCAPEHVYDTYDVLAPLRLAGAGGQPAVLAIQAFNYAAGKSDSKVLLALVLTFANGTQAAAAGTGAGAWRVLPADDYLNASCCTAQQWFLAPREGFVAAREPVGWRLPAFDDSAWEAAREAAPFAAPLVARPTVPLAVAVGVRPALVTRVAPGHFFIDMGREVQGGLTVAFSNASDGQVVLARYGEELLAQAGPPAVRYEMRTGNSYWMAWTLRANGVDGAPFFIENHEYLEWRYAELVAPAPAPLQCARSAAADYTTPVTLTCADPAATITGVTFASWGTPSGACDDDGAGGAGANTFAVDAACAYAGSAAVLHGLCVGRVGQCTFTPSDALFGGADPCDKVEKWVAAAVACNNSAAAVAAAAAAAASYPGWVPDVSAWVVTYPAAYVGDSQLDVPSSALMAVWNLSVYTAVATPIDMYTDSNTRQRSVVCSEAVLVNIMMQWATSAEWALQRYTLEYILNGRPHNLGWAEWQALSIFAVYEIWVHTGDLSLFAERYAQLRNFTELPLINPDGLWVCNAAGDFDCSHPELDWPTNMRDGFVYTPATAFVNGYVALAMRRFAAMANALGGHASDVALFNSTAATVARAVHAAAFNATLGAYVDGVGTTHAAWHTSMYLLAMGVPPPDAAPAVWAYVVRRSVGDPTTCMPSNVYPAFWALEAFYNNASDYGHTGLALLTCNGTNSWLAMIAAGATTTFESWQLEEKWNPTLSHAWAASPAEAIPRLLFGVRPLSPGFAAILIQPQPGSLPSGRITVPSIRGPISLAFTQVLAEGATWPSAVQLQLRTPGNTVACVCLPASACAAGSITLDGVPQPAQRDGDYACLDGVPGGAPHTAACG